MRTIISAPAAALVAALSVAAPLPGLQAPPAADEAEGRRAGTAAANSLSGGWFARGLVGGLVGGPIGTGVAFVLAGRSDVEIPEARARELEGASPLFSHAFREAYEEQRRMKRKESAAVGGILGTVAWTWAILRAVDLIGGGDLEGDPGQPQPGV